MADYIGRNEEPEEEEVQTFNIGGEEYTQEQVEHFIGLGKLGAEAEEKYNTKLDKVWPDYTKTKNEMKRLQDELEELRNKPQPQQQVASQPTSFEDDFQRQQALKAAKDLGLVTSDMLESVVRKEEFGNLYYETAQEAKQVEKALRLEQEIDGSDGRPAFRADDVINYMKDTGIRDIEVAYEVMNKDSIDNWKVEKAVALKSEKSKAFNTLDTSSAGSTREPKPVKVTRDNLDEMIRQGMSGNL